MDLASYLPRACACTVLAKTSIAFYIQYHISTVDVVFASKPPNHYSPSVSAAHMHTISLFSASSAATPALTSAWKHVLYKLLIWQSACRQLR